VGSFAFVHREMYSPFFGEEEKNVKDKVSGIKDSKISLSGPVYVVRSAYN
jgi:hypothetical protein